MTVKSEETVCLNRLKTATRVCVCSRYFALVDHAVTVGYDLLWPSFLSVILNNFSEFLSVKKKT